MKNKIASILLFAALFSIFQATGQIVSPPDANGFSFGQKFDPQFIANNKIREIRGVVESKKDGDRIRKTHQNYVYRFYPDGNLQMLSLINHKLGDTSITIYQYAGQRLSCEIKNDAAGMYSYCYTYSQDSLPLTKKYGRAARSKRVYQDSKIEETTLVSTEAYEHIWYENQLHTTLKNASGRPYQKEIRYYDAYGYLLKYIRSFVLSSDRYEEAYAYEKHGWLEEKKVLSTRGDYTLKYIYDEVGNIYAEERYERDVLIYRKEYVYEEKNMLLRAELRRDDTENLIYITTYTYQYW